MARGKLITNNQKMVTKNLEEFLNLRFRNPELLREALTHRSYLNENPRERTRDNERLEYLGDAVLELIVSEFLFEKFPEYEEGKLTSIRAALVNYQMLARIAKEIDLQKYILLSRGESKDTGKAREVIMANALEALIGAAYLDQGYAKTKEIITSILFPKLEEVIEKGLYRDSKSLLQEIAQEQWRVTPNYKVITEMGPDHKKRFVVGVYFGEELKERGEGTSKQEAESDAATRFLKKLEIGKN